MMVCVPQSPTQSLATCAPVQRKAEEEEEEEEEEQRIESPTH